MLAELDIKPALDRAKYDDDHPGTYDEAAVTRAWQAFSQIDAVFKEFKSGLRNESGPVQLWPHHFDLAVLWFSGRHVSGIDLADEESADEQMNFGFSTGDEAIPDPYFYITAYPRPDTFTTAALPAGAYWHTSGFTAAILPYESVRTAENPQTTLLSFLKALHKHGAAFMIVQA
jgi:hypothetical protein